MSAAAARFTFDLDLGHVGEKRRVLTEGALADMLAAARAEGRAEGLAEGENGTNARAAQALAAAANALASRTVEMAAAMDDARTEILADAVNVAASVGRKLAHKLLCGQARSPAGRRRLRPRRSIPASASSTARPPGSSGCRRPCR